MEANYEENELSYQEEYYFHEIFNMISIDIVSDEYFDRNYEMLRGLSNELFYINQRSKNMPPKLARRVIESFLSNIFRFGIK